MEGIPGNLKKLVASESRLYSLILRCRKPEAKEFKRWVTHKVLPQIRKTGGNIPINDQGKYRNVHYRNTKKAEP